MAKKRTISIRKILQVATTIVVSVCCVIAMVSASRIEDKKMVKSVAIHLKNDKKYHFIQEQQILDLAITNRQVDIVHTPAAMLNLHGMEQAIKADPWVAGAQVYIDNDGILQVYVTQRIPVARIFQKDTKSYYLDTTLSIMPLSASNIYYTTVITNVPELKNDSAGWVLRKNIITLVRTLQADTFWNAQVAEVVVDSLGQFDLLPVIGDQKILLGDATNINTKLNNLFAFYTNILNRIGWDKYDVLDVRFAGQVVATPSLPYNGPIDKAVNNMNWINSIVETEALKDSKDSVRQDRVIKAQPAKPLQKTVLKSKKEIAKKNEKKTNASELKKDKNKGKKNNKVADQKQKSPKYVYPKKDH